MCVCCCGDKLTCAVTILVLVLIAGTLCHVQHDIYVIPVDFELC